MVEQPKKLLSSIIILFLVLIIFNLIIDSTLVFNNILLTLRLWLFKVYPPIFLFYILSSLIINLNIIGKSNRFFSKIFKFKFTRSYSIFTMSMLIGNPASSALILENLDGNNIDLEDGNNLLCISSFLNPLFIISFVSSNFLNNRYSLLIIFSHILSNFMIGFFLFFNKKKTILLKETKKNNDKNIIQEFFDSIERANFLLLKVCGIMVVCNLFKHSIQTILNIINFNNQPITMFLSIIEVASGLNDLINLNLTQELTISLIAFIVSFGGLSIHLQVYSIISKSKLKYKNFFIARVIQAILALIITLYILKIKSFNIRQFFVLIIFTLVLILFRKVKLKKIKA